MTRSSNIFVSEKKPDNVSPEESCSILLAGLACIIYLAFVFLYITFFQVFEPILPCFFNFICKKANGCYFWLLLQYIPCVPVSLLLFDYVRCWTFQCAESIPIQMAAMLGAKVIVVVSGSEAIDFYADYRSVGKFLGSKQC